MMQAFREQAEQVLLSYADDADRAGKPHVARSERMMAAAAMTGEIDNGATIKRLMQEAGL